MPKHQTLKFSYNFKAESDKQKSIGTHFGAFVIKETKSATFNIFRKIYFLFKSFVKVELSYVFTINLFTIAENCMKK